MTDKETMPRVTFSCGMHAVEQAKGEAHCPYCELAAANARLAGIVEECARVCDKAAIECRSHAFQGDYIKGAGNEAESLAIAIRALAPAVAEKVKTETYDQHALDLCNVCGWRAYLPVDGECLVCKRNAAMLTDVPAPQSEQPAVGVVVPRPTEIKPVGKHSLQFIYFGDTTRDDVLALLAAAQEPRK